MSKIASRYRVGETFDGEVGELQKQMKETYKQIAPRLNVKPDMVVTDRNPTVNDRNHDISTFWFRHDTQNLWILSSNNPVTWTVII